MKKRLLFFLLLAGCFLAPVVSAQSAQVLFDEANDILSSGDYEAALQNYQLIEQSGEVSGALYLNMGIVATQLDSMGLAKYYFLKSREFESTRESAQEALEYTESQFSRQSAILPKLPWDKAVEQLIGGPGVFSVFITGIVLVLSGILLVFLIWFAGFSLPRQSTVIASLWLGGGAVILLSFYLNYVDVRYREAVVIDTEAEVLKQAEQGSDLVSLAYEGYSVTVDERKSARHPGWVYIRLGNGQYGWIHPESLKTL